MCLCFAWAKLQTLIYVLSSTHYQSYVVTQPEFSSSSVAVATADPLQTDLDEIPLVHHSAELQEEEEEEEDEDTGYLHSPFQETALAFGKSLFYLSFLSSRKLHT